MRVKRKGVRCRYRDPATLATPSIQVARDVVQVIANFLGFCRGKGDCYVRKPSSESILPLSLSLPFSWCSPRTLGGSGRRLLRYNAQWWLSIQCRMRFCCSLLTTLTIRILNGWTIRGVICISGGEGWIDESWIVRKG